MLALFRAGVPSDPPSEALERLKRGTWTCLLPVPTTTTTAFLGQSLAAVLTPVKLSTTRQTITFRVDSLGSRHG